MSMEILVEATPEGKTTITVQGVKGKACSGLTKRLEEALGEVKSKKKTKEYFEKPLKAVQRLRR